MGEWSSRDRILPIAGAGGAYRCNPSPLTSRVGGRGRMMDVAVAGIQGSRLGAEGGAGRVDGLAESM